MKVERRIHQVWKEWEKYNIAELMASQGLSSNPLIGKYQYIYSSDKGRISLVELPDYFRDGITLWEIYCQEGDLFEDIERFDTKEEADIRIKELLD